MQQRNGETRSGLHGGENKQIALSAVYSFDKRYISRPRDDNKNK